MPDDSTLISEIQDSSIAAFEALYDRYSTRAWRVALSTCGDERRAEDAVEAAFVSVWTECRSYRAEHGTVAAWLLSAVRNQAVTIVHRDKEDRNSPPSPDARAPRREAAQVGGENAKGAGPSRALRTLLEKLPDAQQEVITLALYGELTHDEIAT
ncbi:MAG: RNA polymerase sigma factor [Solirubrobacteraceae bacterium]